MNPFAGKSPTERNKMIAAIVLGFVALFALYLAFGRGFFASTATNLKVSATPSPTPGSSSINNKKFEMPSQSDADLALSTQPVMYSRASYVTPEPGRNIFAFQEPPPPCDPNRDPNRCVTPTPIKTPPPPTPTPTPPMRLEFVTPQNIYAGSVSFRLEANGDRFDPAARLYFRQAELPTQFVSVQKLVANVPASLIASEGPAQVIAQTPDGKLYSDQVILNVQAPPKPQFDFIGAKLAARGNNDTGYFLEKGKQTPVVARLGDVVGGRFRLISVSRAEAIFQDISLPFKHSLKLYDPPPGTGSSNQRPTPFRPGFNNDPNVYVPYNPNVNPSMQQDIPGIPNNIPRVVPPNPQRSPSKKDEDDDGDGDGLR